MARVQMATAAALGQLVRGDFLSALNSSALRSSLAEGEREGERRRERERERKREREAIIRGNENKWLCVSCSVLPVGGSGSPGNQRRPTACGVPSSIF